MTKRLPHNHGKLPAHLQMPEVGTFQRTSELMKLLSDSTRLEIFWLLCHCEECVINLSALLEMSPPAVSHHLKLLKTAGLVISRREGKEVYYTAADTAPAQTLHKMVEGIVAVACPSEETFAQDYDSAVQTAELVHRRLTEDLKKRYTIAQLAAEFHMNQTTLKSVFKTVFGRSIAEYMKHYRINRAMELLQRGIPISQAAQEVGYGSGSKFAQAFQDVTGVLPREYRRLHRQEPGKAGE